MCCAATAAASASGAPSTITTSAMRKQLATVVASRAVAAQAQPSAAESAPSGNARSGGARFSTAAGSETLSAVAHATTAPVERSSTPSSSLRVARMRELAPSNTSMLAMLAALMA